MRLKLKKYSQSNFKAYQLLLNALVFFTVISSVAKAQNPSDSAKMLKKVTVTAEKKQNSFSSYRSGSNSKS